VKSTDLHFLWDFTLHAKGNHFSMEVYWDIVNEFDNFLLRTSILVLLVKSNSQLTKTIALVVCIFTSHRPKHDSLNQSLCNFIIFPKRMLVPMSAVVYTSPP